MNIILMGYRCTGKTSVGRFLARRLGFPFSDTDELIERHRERTIPQIVAEQGWKAFRDTEAAVIAGLAGTDRRVIALGGGAVVDAQNVERLKKNGVFVWLRATAETIAARMEKDEAQGTERPSLTGEPSIVEIKAIMAEREPLYRRLADITVDTTRSTTDRVAETIFSELSERLPGGGGVIGKKEKEQCPETP